MKTQQANLSWALYLFAILFLNILYNTQSEWHIFNSSSQPFHRFAPLTDIHLPLMFVLGLGSLNISNTPSSCWLSRFQRPPNTARDWNYGIISCSNHKVFPSYDGSDWWHHSQKACWGVWGQTHKVPPSLTGRKTDDVLVTERWQLL